MARLPKNLTLSQSEVSQTFDLEELTGVDLSSNGDLKASIGQALIDKMVKRSESGKDLRGNSLAPYPKSYRQSDQYEAFNKTRKVNMTLSGGMLSLIDVVQDSGNNLKIGWDDSTENAKAYNHMTGDTVTRRQFFGLSGSDAKEVIEDFREEIKEVKEEQDSDLGVTDFLNTITTAETVDNFPATAVISLEALFGEG